MSEAAAFPSREWWRPTLESAAPLAGAAPSASVGSTRSATAFRALLVFMFALLISPQSFVPAFGVLHLAAVSAWIAIAAHVLNARKTGAGILVAHPGLRWALGLAGWALVGVPWSHWPGGSVELLFGLYFKSIVIFWLIGAVVDTRARLKQLVTWMTCLTLPIGATAILHYLNGTFVQGGVASTPRIMGYDAPLTANPNDLALVLSMMLPLALALGVAERRSLPRLALFGLALLDVAGIVVTFSRTGFLTLGALLAFAVVKLLRGSARVFVIGAILFGLALVPLLPGGYFEHMGTITAIDTDPTGSAQNRWSDSLTAATLVLEHPFLGAGPGMSVLALNDARGAEWVPVHNVYLEYATDLGLPGLALFLLLLLACVRGVNRVVRATASMPETRELHCLAVGVQLTLVAFVVAGFFHPVAYHFHFYYAAGLATALAVVWEKEHERRV